MFVRLIPDNKGKRSGFYCALVESKRKNGPSSHDVLYNFGYMDALHAIYLKAAFSSSDPEDVVKSELKRRNIDSTSS